MCLKVIYKIFYFVFYFQKVSSMKKISLISCLLLFSACVSTNTTNEVLSLKRAVENLRTYQMEQSTELNRISEDLQKLRGTIEELEHYKAQEIARNKAAQNIGSTEMNIEPALASELQSDKITKGQGMNAIVPEDLLKEDEIFASKQNIEFGREMLEMIENIKEENIPLMVNDETKELNPQGRQAIKQLVEKYQDQNNFNKIAEIQKDVDEIKVQMKENIKKQVDSMEDVNKLEEKSANLKMHTADYANNANTLKKVTWWQNCKLTIIIAVIIIAIVLAIVLPIVLKD